MTAKRKSVLMILAVILCTVLVAGTTLAYLIDQGDDQETEFIRGSIKVSARTPDQLYLEAGKINYTLEVANASTVQKDRPIYIGVKLSAEDADTAALIGSLSVADLKNYIQFDMVPGCTLFKYGEDLYAFHPSAFVYSDSYKYVINSFTLTGAAESAIPASFKKIIASPIAVTQDNYTDCGSAFLDPAVAGSFTSAGWPNIAEIIKAENQLY